MLTPRDNMRRVLRHERPEWIPLVTHIDTYNQPAREGMPPELAEPLAEVRWGDESTVRFSRWLGVDIFDWFGRPPVRSTGNPVAIERCTEGNDTVTTWHTPRGDLREVVRAAPDVGTSYRVEHVLKSPDDLEAFACFFDERIEPDPDRAQNLADRRALIGEDGMIGLPMPSTPLGMLIRVYAGVETTALLWADAPDALRDTLAAMERNYLDRLRVAAAFDEADALITVDDTSTTTISPRMFEEHGVPYTDRAAAIAHDAGRFYMHHSCGLIRDLLPLYRRTAMDCVHAFTIPPIGNVTVGEGRRLAGDGIALFANLMQITEPFDNWPRIQATVREFFDGADDGRNLIANIFAEPTKTVADHRRLVDECRQYQDVT